MDPYFAWLSDLVKSIKTQLMSYDCTISIMNTPDIKDVTRSPIQVTDNTRETKNLIIDSNNFIRCYEAMRPNSNYNYNASIKEATNRCAKFIKEWLEK